MEQEKQIETNKPSWFKRWIFSDIKTLIFLVFVLILAFMYYHDIQTCSAVMKDPCYYCASTTPAINNYSIILDSYYANESYNKFNSEVIGNERRII